MSLPAWGQDKVVVLELLSSQGCSDTPPAEEAYLDIVEKYKDQIIAFNCHVTFFDKGGWNDSYSHALCDERYQHYENSNLYLKSGIPQTVLNGKFTTSQPRRPILNAMAKMGLVESTVLKIDFNMNGNTLEMNLPTITTDKILDLWLIGYQDFQETTINAGLNEGGIIRQSNLVRYIKRAGRWNGKATAQSLPTPLNEEILEIDGYIILAQEHFDPLLMDGSMEILAAGHVRKTLQSTWH